MTNMPLSLSKRKQLRWMNRAVVAHQKSCGCKHSEKNLWTTSKMQEPLRRSLWCFFSFEVSLRSLHCFHAPKSIFCHPRTPKPPEKTPTPSSLQVSANKGAFQTEVIRVDCRPPASQLQDRAWCPRLFLHCYRLLFKDMRLTEGPVGRDHRFPGRLWALGQRPGKAILKREKSCINI